MSDENKKSKAKKKSKYEVQILLIVLGILAGVGAYYGIYQGNIEEAESIETQNATLQAQVDRLQQLEINCEEYIAATDSMNTYITEFENDYPAYILPEDSILTIRRMEDYNDVEVLSIAFGNETEIPYTSADATTDTTTDTSTESDTQTVEASVIDTSTTYSDAHFYELPISFSVESGYNDFKSLLRYIYNYGERESVRSVSLSFNEETGGLTGNVNLSTFYLQGTQKAYNEPSVPSVEMGVETIFGNLGERVSENAEEGTETEAETESAAQ